LWEDDFCFGFWYIETRRELVLTKIAVDLAIIIIGIISLMGALFVAVGMYEVMIRPLVCFIRFKVLYLKFRWSKNENGALWPVYKSQRWQSSFARADLEDLILKMEKDKSVEIQDFENLISPCHQADRWFEETHPGQKSSSTEERLLSVMANRFKSSG
jgi:hypothetical protein